MTWNVEYTLEFEAWWNDLDDEAQGSIEAHVRMLEVQGPNPGYPYTSAVNGSKHGHMRELRVQSKVDRFASSMRSIHAEAQFC